MGLVSHPFSVMPTTRDNDLDPELGALPTSPGTPVDGCRTLDPTDHDGAKKTSGRRTSKNERLTNEEKCRLVEREEGRPQFQ